MGRTTSIGVRVRPSIDRASSPTATMRLSFTVSATTDGSCSTIRLAHVNEPFTAEIDSDFPLQHSTILAAGEFTSPRR